MGIEVTNHCYDILAWYRKQGVWVAKNDVTDVHIPCDITKDAGGGSA